MHTDTNADPKTEKSPRAIAPAHAPAEAPLPVGSHAQYARDV